jgi:hypothetical protein
MVWTWEFLYGALAPFSSKNGLGNEYVHSSCSTMPSELFPQTQREKTILKTAKQV